MLSEKLIKELNEQIKHEFFSAYYYLSMASWCETENLTGAAQFLKLQAQEECGHAMKFFSYVHEQGAKVALQPLEAPKAAFSSLLEIFELSLEHEKLVTKKIYTIMDTASTEKEYATMSFLRVLVDEQVEEESSMDKIVKKIRFVANDPAGILLIDSQLGARSPETA